MLPMRTDEALSLSRYLGLYPPRSVIPGSLGDDGTSRSIQRDHLAMTEDRTGSMSKHSQPLHPGVVLVNVVAAARRHPSKESRVKGESRESQELARHVAEIDRCTSAR
jgi:hypothetical protein